MSSTSSSKKRGPCAWAHRFGGSCNLNLVDYSWYLEQALSHIPADKLWIQIVEDFNATRKNDLAEWLGIVNNTNTTKKLSHKTKVGNGKNPSKETGTLKLDVRPCFCGSLLSHRSPLPHVLGVMCVRPCTYLSFFVFFFLHLNAATYMPDDNHAARECCRRHHFAANCSDAQYVGRSSRSVVASGQYSMREQGWCLFVPLVS